MNQEISVELAGDVLAILEEEARARGISLSELLSEAASAEAKRLRKRRIREQSEAVAAYVASNPEARQFYEDWGTPRSDGL